MPLMNRGLCNVKAMLVWLLELIKGAAGFANRDKRNYCLLYRHISRKKYSERRLPDRWREIHDNKGR